MRIQDREHAKSTRAGGRKEERDLARRGTCTQLWQILCRHGTIRVSHCSSKQMLQTFASPASPSAFEACSER